MDPVVDLTSDKSGGAAASTTTVADLQRSMQLVEEELLDVEESLAALRRRQQQLNKQKEELKQRIATEQRAPRADWQGSFPWDQQVQHALTHTFGLTEFRPLQRQVINATLSNRHVLVLMPTGLGKSLACYQLPALISGGVTLVVSPLLSLIVDQVMGLQGRVQAYGLTSLSTKEETAAIMAALTAAAAVASQPPKGKGKAAAAAAAAAAGAAGAEQQAAAQQPMLLYCTPEKLIASKRLMSKLEKLHQAGKLARIAIDECHCCSSWGNDFRPDYKKLGILSQQFPRTPIIALTATATTQVAKDVIDILGIAGCERFAASINRPNLFWSVVHKQANSEFEQLRDYITDKYPDPTEQGIVYCLTRKDCEVLADKLSGAGITATHYHADMEPQSRSASHIAWSEGHIKVVVATISFGMGINKSNVRFVIHGCLPKSLESYYQEAGRAGRDLQPASCVLFYRLADVLRQASVVCMDYGWARHLNSIMRYAATPGQGCRRATLAAHFEEPAPACNGTCDLCAAAAAAAGADAGGSDSPQQQPQQQQQQQQDLTEPAQLVVKLLQERKAEKRATLNQLLDDMQKAFRKASSSSTGSMLASRDEHEWLVQEMLLQNLLNMDFGFTAYNTNTYLVAAPAAASLGRQRLLSVRPSWLQAGSQPQQPPQPQPQPSSKKRASNAASTQAPAAKSRQPQPPAAKSRQPQPPAAKSRQPQPPAQNQQPAAVVIDSDEDDDDEDWM